MGRTLGWLLVPLALVGCAPSAPPARRAVAVGETLSVGATLSSAPAAGFARALEPRAFEFPSDHGPHEGFRTEWWYFTGNLEGANGRRFGYQLTFFRNALEPEAPDSPSRWAARDVWMAHLALTDVAAERFHAFDRFERGALGLAGAHAEPFAVWTGPWRAAADAEDTFPLRLRAQQEGIAIDLVLEPRKEPVLQGDRGLSQKGSEPGNASYYYSYTRLATRGTVTTAQGDHAVEGSSWLDREWSTSALEAGQVGWDWFALQLEDGRELMLYQLRGEDGTPSPQSAGAWVGVDGSARKLGQADFVLEPLATWTSPASGAVYPSRWRVGLPSEDLELEVRPVLADQELDLAFRYWEGAVDVSGRSGTSAVSGRGYVELTGYGPAGRR